MQKKKEKKLTSVSFMYVCVAGNGEIDVTSVTLSRFNSINAIDVTGYLGDILRIFFGYFWNIF